MDDAGLISDAIARHEITELFARYAWSHDTCNLDAYLDCFTTAAVFTMVPAEGGEGAELHGHGELKAFQTPRWAKRTASQRHVITNFTFTSIGKNEAVVHSYLSLFRTQPGQLPQIRVIGAYRAVVLGGNGLWRISELTLTED